MYYILPNEVHNIYYILPKRKHEGRKHITLLHYNTMFRSFFIAGLPSPTHKAKLRRSSHPAFTSLTASPLLSNSLHHTNQSSPPHIETQTPHSNATYGYLLNRFKDSRTSNEAETFHLRIFKHGFTQDLFLCNTLINVYVKIGALANARKLFDEMPDKNSVTWACLISGYARSGVPEEACGQFKRMVCDGFVPSVYAFGSVLRACQELGPCKLKFGMQVQGLLSKMHDSDVLLANVLMSMYGRCLGSADDAYRAFCEIKFRNLVSWNSIISVYCQRGDAVFAYKLFSNMQKDGVDFDLQPNEYTFGSLVPACCSLADSGLVLLQQMLSRVSKAGFLQDLYVGSALVSGFARVGLVDYARKIFEQMGERNVVSMNGLMVGLVRQKRGEEATQVFMEMKDLGREVHAYVIATGLINSKVAIENGLVNMYAKCGAIDDACSVFRLMVDRDLISWNSLISGLDQNERFEDAVMKFCEMRKSELKPSIFTLISALSSCASLEWIMMGQQIHCEALKLGLDLDVSVSNALLALYSDTGCLNESRNVFFLMQEYDQVSWNSIVGALASSEASVFEAVEYLLEMMRSGWELNRVTFISILSAVSSLSLHELGQQIHAVVLKYNAAKDCAIENALIACYGKCGQIEDCEKIFSRMPERRDEVSWNSMISGYIHNELLPKAMDLVWFMMQRGQRLDSFTFATVLSACASVATLERGMEVHASAIRACLKSDVVVGSALVDMYSKCGRIDYASRFFKLMPVRNVYSWNSLISGYARNGDGQKALRLFTQMKQQDQPPDHVTFVGVLSACSHAGLVDEGFQHFNSMSKVHGLAPRMEHFSCMVDLLGRAGKINMIEDFIKKMPLKPNVLIWRTVLGACCRGNGCNTELGRMAGEMLLELEPQNAVNYVLLANMYASGGKWDDVAKARMTMRKAAVKKEAGCSWVTMKDGVHVFVAGDKLHPEKDLIYEKLKELNKKMRNAGYVPETKFALYDLELENKEELLSYHSEKLAVAYVLTRQSQLPIRIMKNLRVCGDCHTAFKYISNIVGRQIVLRDSNRFHHFQDGKCSCGDFW
ncbi:putative tetratricopeptide-like helical domain, DYW domain-containing protein [Rosa chinensis]|uniref:Putative tetratricopeptide-like helical domain, DYW domain-containing protein n=1 Tax=Rosa chinensis TaxID=74649 RepID=A0A2P6S1E9_ROSCH|nr:putative tetratricopeptide-like helical domain, DYW domain-containing protein [Rosa chinensis]